MKQNRSQTCVPSLLATTALRRPAKLECSQVSSTSIFTKVLVGLGNTPKLGNRFNRPGIHHIQVWKNIPVKNIHLFLAKTTIF